MVVGVMPWMVIRPVIADEGMVRGPRAPGIACIDRPDQTGGKRADGMGRRETGSNREESKRKEGNALEQSSIFTTCCCFFLLFSDKLCKVFL